MAIFNRSTRSSRILSALTLGALAYFGCLSMSLSATELVDNKQSARAMIQSKSDSDVSGQVTFKDLGDSIEITGQIEGLKPGSTHGIHIHEKGDCNSPDAKSAGGHFNPMNVKHGSPNDKVHHVGDMGNFTANEEGNLIINKTVKYMDLFPMDSPRSILGKAFIVHSGKDDLRSQPAGDAGKRIGCGVIQ